MSNDFIESINRISFYIQATAFCAVLAFKTILALVMPEAGVQDDHGFAAMKEIAYDYLKRKWKIFDLQKISVFFHPKLKSLRIFEDERNEIMAAIRIEVAKIQEQHQEQQQEQAPSQTQDDDRVATKRGKSFVDEFFNAEIDSISNTEVDKYVNTPLIIQGDHVNDFDVCRWWFEHRKTYPHLYVMSKKYLCVPASTATAERKFSIAKFLINEKRTRLLPGTINDIMILNNNR